MNPGYGDIYFEENEQGYDRMTGPLSIAIVGAGTAGLGAALALARQGHAVSLFERVPEPGPVGAGILLQPTGQAVVGDWGLLPELLGLGSVVHRLQGLSATGRRVMDLAYEGSPGLGLHRGALFGVLWRAAREAGAVLHSGTAVAGIRRCADGIRLDAPDAELGCFDLLIWAAGTFGEWPDSLGLQRRVQLYPWGALWALLPDTGLPWPGILHQWYRGAREMLGVMPTGWRGAEERSSPPWSSLFWSLPLADHAGWRRQAEDQGLDPWKHKVLALAPQLEPWLHSLKTADDLALARYADVRMKRMIGDRVVAIGDAAHATSPQLGQGANMALIDAWVLADAVAQAADLPSALLAFQSRRQGHLAYYQGASRLLTPVYQSHQRLLPWLRDLFSYPAGRLPPGRRLMHKTLTGRQGSWWGGSWTDGPRTG